MRIKNNHKPLEQKFIAEYLYSGGSIEKLAAPLGNNLCPQS
jgi:hypothetical protein